MYIMWQEWPEWQVWQLWKSANAEEVNGSGFETDMWMYLQLKPCEEQ